MFGAADEVWQQPGAACRIGQRAAVKHAGSGDKAESARQAVGKLDLLCAAVAHIAHTNGVVHQVASVNLDLRGGLVYGERRHHDPIGHFVALLYAAVVVADVGTVPYQRAGCRPAVWGQGDRNGDDLLLMRTDGGEGRAHLVAAVRAVIHTHHLQPAVDNVGDDHVVERGVDGLRRHDHPVDKGGAVGQFAWLYRFLQRAGRCAYRGIGRGAGVAAFIREPIAVAVGGTPGLVLYWATLARSVRTRSAEMPAATRAR